MRNSALTPYLGPEEHDGIWELTRSQPNAYSDWQYEVANGDTIGSFQQWLNNRRVQYES